MKRVLFTILTLCFCISLSGCSSKSADSSKNDNISGSMIVDEKISPNEEYVSSDSDIVYYTVKIYQDKNNSVTVDTESNNSFFKPIQYSLACNESITKDDIDIQWTTLMGDSNATEDNQLAIADISISIDHTVISERKVNFVNSGMEIIVDTINNK